MPGQYPGPQRAVQLRPGQRLLADAADLAVPSRIAERIHLQAGPGQQDMVAAPRRPLGQPGQGVVPAGYVAAAV